MKRIEFIAPVEAMRGNLSGKQNLLYAENDNPAYDGPVGAVNYARNYQPRFIGAKVSKSGLKYFTVRTKSANHLTSKSKKAMALLGAAGALYAAIVKVKSTATYNGIYNQWAKLVEYGSTQTFREYVMGIIRPVLVAKGQNITFSGPLTAVTIKNPWFNGSQSADAQVSSGILVKFWGELHKDGIYFSVDGMKGIATEGDSFQDVCDSQYNVLSLITDGDDYVRIGSSTGAFIVNGAGDYMAGNNALDAADAYATTDVTPEP